MEPPSDIDVDLSSDAGSDNPIDAAEVEAAQLLHSSKLYGFGSTANNSSSSSANPRRMDFSPTPSPPPPPQQQQQQQHPLHLQHPPLSLHSPLTHTHLPVLAPASASTALPPHLPLVTAADSINGDGDADASDVGSVKDGSVESSSVRHASSPAVAGAAATPARARTSIWVHFTRDPDYATNRRGRCVYCHNYYSCSSGSTGNMWRHIKRSHPDKASTTAPVATHAAHINAPQPPTPTPAQPSGSGTAGGSDNRPRKRHASFSSPSAEHLPRSNPQTRALQRPHDDTAHAHAYSYPEVSARSQRSHPDDISALGPEAAGSSSESLAHALKLLLSLGARPNSAGDRSGSNASSALLMNLLENLNSAAASRSSQPGFIDSTLGMAESPGTSRMQRAPSYRPTGAGASASNNSGNLPTIAERASSSELYGTSLSSSRPLRGFGAHSDFVDTESISHFVAAVADAVRAHTGSDDDGSTASGTGRKTLKAYIDFMVRDLVPVDRMLAPAMQQLMASMSHSATPTPSAKVLVDELFRLKDTKLQALHRQLDAVSGRISVSIGSGCLSSTMHYLAVHAHWLDTSFVRHDELLDWHCLEGAATSADIISVFESTLTKFGLFDRLGAVATNYTREFVEFLNQLETICHARGVPFDLDRNQATCIVSTLLDAREKLISSLRQPSAPTGQSPMRIDSAADSDLSASPLRKLSVAIRNLCRPEAPGAQQLATLCREHAVEQSAFDFDPSRPWDSNVALLDAALPIYAGLSDILHQRTEAAPPAVALSSAEWLALSQARVLMHLLNVTTDSLAQLPVEFPGIVDIVPVYDALVDNVLGFLQAPTLCTEVRRSAEILRDYLTQSHPFQASPIYRLAPVFDPRLKATYYTDRSYEQVWANRVVREAQTMLSEFATSEAVAPPPQDAAANNEPHPFALSAAATQQSDIKSQIDAFIRLGDPKTTSQVIANSRTRTFRRAFASARSDLEDYLSAPLAAPNVPVASWWSTHHATFPDLASLAREYLSIPASSNAVSLLLKRKPMPDFSQLAGLDKKLVSAYACLHHWQAKDN
ncbi:hypothetical protein IWW37_002482 [Coemansia sp. RSA 2050]|nr:hypothetical protein IWW37_002482 [Coemansia sp. RSA 2050]KAJ2734239.1 hypothetical protein IW152_002478 [Coemansia sp. BCRC 34962]